MSRWTPSQRRRSARPLFETVGALLLLLLLLLVLPCVATPPSHRVGFRGFPGSATWSAPTEPDGDRDPERAADSTARLHHPLPGASPTDDTGRIAAAPPKASPLSIGEGGHNGGEEAGAKGEHMHAARKFFGQVDTDETLADAVRTAAGAGGTDIVLVAVDGRSQTKHLVTALNTVHNLRRLRSDNVFLLTSGERDCRYLSAQHVVPVRVCTWSDQLLNKSDWWLSFDASQGASRIWHLRLHFFSRILEVMPEVGVLMSDTDVCFHANPHTFLSSTGMSVVLNGPPDGINIGLIYAKKRHGTPPNTFGLFSEIDRRLSAFRRAGANTRNVTGQNGQVMWDQAVVNDVLQQWVTGNATYFRSCWLGFGAKKATTCFSECCTSPHPFGLRAGPREEEDTMAWNIDHTMRPLMRSHGFEGPDGIHRGGISFTTQPEVMTYSLGNCGAAKAPMEHENQCHIRGLSKTDWMQNRTCWFDKLEVLLSDADRPLT